MSSLMYFSKSIHNSYDNSDHNKMFDRVPVAYFVVACVCVGVIYFFTRPTEYGDAFDDAPHTVNAYDIRELTKALE